MRKPPGSKTYNKVHRKLSEAAADMHKQELVDAIVKMIMSERDDHESAIEGLMKEALQLRTIQQLRRLLE